MPSTLPAADPVPSVARTPARRHALAAREAKRKAAHAMAIDADFISRLVDRFYTKVRDDATLGPIFASRISDWPSHLQRMKAFWGSVLRNSGEYTGSPMRQHLAIPGLEHTHFTIWLALFEQTLTEIERDAAATAHILDRARMIATSLLNAIVINRDGLDAARSVKDF